MADELDLDLDETSQEVNKTEKRIKDLSEKVKLTSQERDEKDKLLQEKDQKLVNAEKEVDFFKNFSQMTSKYSGANEYQDQIKEKVMAGYDVEDATISILAKEGKFVTPEPSPLPRESPIGGSAVNAMKSGGDKSIGEMTQEERKSALLQAEAEGGEISKILRM